MPQHDAPLFTRSVFRLVMVMEDRHLPIPLRIGWHPFPPRLEVQVHGPDYRAWYAALGDDVVVRNETVAEDVHVHAVASLADDPKVNVHLLGVLDASEAVPS